MISQQYCILLWCLLYLCLNWKIKGLHSPIFNMHSLQVNELLLMVSVMSAQELVPFEELLSVETDQGVQKVMQRDWPITRGDVSIIARWRGEWRFAVTPLLKCWWLVFLFACESPIINRFTSYLGRDFHVTSFVCERYFPSGKACWYSLTAQFGSINHRSSVTVFTGVSKQPVSAQRALNPRWIYGRW